MTPTFLFVFFLFAKVQTSLPCSPPLQKKKMIKITTLATQTRGRPLVLQGHHPPYHARRPRPGRHLHRVRVPQEQAREAQALHPIRGPLRGMSDSKLQKCYCHAPALPCVDAKKKKELTHCTVGPARLQCTSLSCVSTWMVGEEEEYEDWLGVQGKGEKGSR